jgi:hypothetical protein
VILAFRSLRQEDCEFKASLVCIARPCLGREREKDRKREREREKEREREI